MKRLKFPTAHTVLLLIAAMVAVFTWIIPSGKYDTLRYNSAAETFEISGFEKTVTLAAKQEKLDSLDMKIPIEKFTSGAIYKSMSIPNTYKTLQSRPQGLGPLILSPIKGIIAAADIIFLVLIIGGLIGIMNLTGAFDAGISWLATTLKGREFLLIILVTTLTAIGGTTFGMSEETIAFYPILIPIFMAAGYDAMVGLSCVFIGAGIGSMIGITNPFATIIASDAAGITWSTGLTGRFIFLLVGLVVCVLYILRYANRVKRDPSKSLVFGQRKELNALFGLESSTDSVAFTNRLRLILGIFAATFVMMIIGVSVLDWWFVEMTATFLVGAIAIGYVGRVKESDFVEAFSKGAAELLSVAFIIGIARGVTILMDDGLISDTILYHASTVTEGMNKGLFVNALLFVYAGLSFFIPSQSGMAVLTMPIMSPLADSVGIGREIVVNAYQYGMGLLYFINPTSMILAALAVVKIGFDKWLKFMMPLLIILTIMTMIALTLSVY